MRKSMRRIRRTRRKTRVAKRKMYARRKSIRNRRRFRGGNYASDITTKEYQGFPYKNEQSLVVSYPGGVMDLKDYKGMMEDEDREGYDPLA